MDSKDASNRTGAHDRIEIRELVKHFHTKNGPVAALDALDLNVADGQFCCIVGPSGCGKTTLLRILAGLEEPTDGHLTLHQRDSSKPLNAMVFQEQSVFPWMTVRRNIGYGLRMRGVDRAKARETVDYYLKQTSLLPFANAYPFQLSGGMKQRVSVARAFATDAEVLLMDEPFASLDEQNKILLQEELLRIWGESKKTVLFITHSIDEAVALGDRVIIMTARPGRVKADVPIELPRPRHVYELKASRGFGELVYHIWGVLRDEVLAARRDQEGYEDQ